MSQLPAISVIVAVLNQADNLRQALEGLFLQTHPALEVIVIDGGSEDATPDFLGTRNDRLAYWCSEPDRGIYDAWNKGLARCHGEWILFLGADDRLVSERALEQAATLLARVPQTCRVAYGDMERVGGDGRVLGMVPGSQRFDRRGFIGRMYLPHPALFYRRDYFQEHGAFDTDFRIAGDYDMLLRELKSRDPCHFDLTVSRMAEGGISDNPRYGMLQIRERFKALRNNGISPWQPALLRQAAGEVLFHGCGALLGAGPTRWLRLGWRRWRPFA
jgi:glycosyltransferase involved in cell wall biosynthesis